MSEIKKIWNKGAAVYDEQVRNFLPYHRSHEVIVDLLTTTKMMRILDLGSGTGIVSEKILKAIPTVSITCIDFSARMIDESKRRLAQFESRVDFVCADFAEWNVKQNYDAIVTCNALIYMGVNVGKSYSKFADCLAPGGLFLNSTIVKYEADLPKFMEKLFYSGSQSKESADFAQGPGKRISSHCGHCGEDSLLAPLSIQEHIDFMTNAGLKSICVWQYLFQTIIMGVKT